jgi:predicted  nucleic acid-binding Zn-ribbon protein
LVLGGFLIKKCVICGREFEPKKKNYVQICCIPECSKIRWSQKRISREEKMKALRQEKRHQREVEKERQREQKYQERERREKERQEQRHNESRLLLESKRTSFEEEELDVIRTIFERTRELSRCKCADLKLLRVGLTGSSEVFAKCPTYGFYDYTINGIWQGVAPFPVKLIKTS